MAPETRDRILAVARRAGLDAEPPGPRAGGVPRARGRPGDRPPAGDPRLGPVLPGVHRRRRVGAGAARPVPALAGRARTASASWRGTAAGRRGRVDGVFLTDLRVDDPRPRCSAEIGLPAVSIGPDCVEHSLAVRRRRRPARASRPPSSTSSSSATGASPTSPGRHEFVHGASAQAWAETLRAAGLPEGPCVESDFTAAGRRRRPPGSCSTWPEPPDRDRLRQRPDGHRRHGRGAPPAGSTSPATCRSPASTTPRSPPTSSPR